MKKKAGQPPGSLEGIAVEYAQPTAIRWISFDEDHYKNTHVDDTASLPAMVKKGAANWIHITGLKDVKIIQKVCDLFDVSQLILEDVFNTEHLPKFDDMGDQIYLTLNIIEPKNGTNELIMNHVSLILSQDVIITVLEEETTMFDPFIVRIETAIGKIRERRNDYLLYRLSDIIVDHYFQLLEHSDTTLFEIEEILIRDQSADLVNRIQEEKKELMFLKKNIFPVSEALRALLKSDSKLIKTSNLSFFSDTVDHLVHLVQSIDNYRETVGNLMDLQFANNSNQMNDVMKTLTIIATIFIPLTFLAGIYGMNFEYMPELGIRWAYPALMIMMFVLGVGMYFYMKRKRWF